MVSSRVASEKSTRMIEVLATSASPAELLCGKVLGVGTAGFLQVSVFYTALLALGGAALHRLSGLSDYAAGILSGIVSSAAQNMGAVFLYLLLGFFQLAFIYGGIGAMSTDNDSVSGFAAIPLQLPSIGYMIAMLAPSISGSALLNAASYIPLVAPFAMPARLGVSEVSLWEVLLSLIIQFSFIALTAVISAKLYRRCMLRYGQPPKIREIFSIITSRSRT